LIPRKLTEAVGAIHKTGGLGAFYVGYGTMALSPENGTATGGTGEWDISVFETQFLSVEKCWATSLSFEVMREIPFSFIQFPLYEGYLGCKCWLEMVEGCGPKTRLLPTRVCQVQEVRSREARQRNYCAARRLGGTGSWEVE